MTKTFDTREHDNAGWFRLLTGRMTERMDTEDFGTWLARQLRRQELTQAEFAERLDVTRAAVSAWVTGRAEPRPEKLRAIAEILQVDVSAVFNREEDPLHESALTWYHRPAHTDGGREFGNAAAFAFEPSLSTLVREATQNSLDERVDPSRPVRVRFTVHEISGERLFEFLNALHWDDELAEHYEQAANHGKKVGRTIAEALTTMREHSRLTLIRVDDYNASGLTGDDFDDAEGDNRFAAVMRRQLESHKSSSTAGGSFGLGKVAFWSTSRLGLVLANSTLSRPHEGRRERRMIGRLDLPWRRLEDGTAFAGPAWFGEPDHAHKGATRSWWADERAATNLYLERGSSDPGTSFLVVGVEDSILTTAPDIGELDAESDQARRAILRAMHEELVYALAENFWAAMVFGDDHPALLEASVTTLRNGAVVVPEERVRPESARPSGTRALQAYFNGAVTAQLAADDDVAMTTVPLTIPPRKDQQDGRRHPVLHEAVLLVTTASDADGMSENSLVCMRGNRMEIESRSIGDTLSPGRFTAILLAGQAAGLATIESAAAEEFLRAAEPAAHNAWRRTEDLTTTFARGAAARLEEFRRAMLPAVYSITRRPVSGAVDDGPGLLRELLTLNISAPSRSPGFPTVKRVDGGIDASGAWNLEVEVRVPERPDPWTFKPVLRFVTRSGPSIPVDWNHLEAAAGCEVTGDGLVRCAAGARSVAIRGVSDVSTHPVTASMSRTTVELQSTKEGDA